MPRVKFTADPRLPPHKGGRTWTHEVGGRTFDMGADGKPTSTYRLVEPQRYASGESFDVTDSQADWLLHHYPQCFQILGEVALAAELVAAPESQPGVES